MLVLTQFERKIYIYIFVSREIQLFHFLPSVLNSDTRLFVQCIELDYVKIDRYINLETFVFTGQIQRTTEIHGVSVRFRIMWQVAG